MPVDYFIALIPLVFLISVFVSIFFKRIRIYAMVLALVALSSFVWIYLAPEWLLMQSANAGNAEAQLKLGYYYDTRFGNLGSGLDKRDFWFLKAAQTGEPHAMELVGYFYIFGSSSVIKKDFSKAQYWLNAAAKAGDKDAIEDLKRLPELEKEK